jgi:hypothetical protein
VDVDTPLRCAAELFAFNTQSATVAPQHPTTSSPNLLEALQIVTQLGVQGRGGDLREARGRVCGVMSID